MFFDVFEPVRIIYNFEIETPIFRDARLPQIASFIVFLGAERRMVKILGKKVKLFPKGFSNSERSDFQGVEHPVGKVDLHRLDDLRFFAAARLLCRLASIEAMAAAAVSNGP